jgi:hypothetical protein
MKVSWNNPQRKIWIVQKQNRTDVLSLQDTFCDIGVVRWSSGTVYLIKLFQLTILSSANLVRRKPQYCIFPQLAFSFLFCNFHLKPMACSIYVLLNIWKLNYRIIVNTVQCDLICRYLLPLHVSVSWPSSEGIRSTSSGTITKFVIHT